MTAKEYLEQLAAIDEMIQQDLERLEGMKQDAVLPRGIDYSGDLVQKVPRIARTIPEQKMNNPYYHT